jgi:hypothetical protein
MYHQISDLSDQATCLRDKICAFSVMIPSIISNEQTFDDKVQCGVSLILDDLAADAEALLSHIDELRCDLAKGK